MLEFVGAGKQLKKMKLKKIEVKAARNDPGKENCSPLCDNLDVSHSRPACNPTKRNTVISVSTNAEEETNEKRI